MVGWGYESVHEGLGLGTGWGYELGRDGWGLGQDWDVGIRVGP